MRSLPLQPNSKTQPRNGSKPSPQRSAMLGAVAEEAVAAAVAVEVGPHLVQRHQTRQRHRQPHAPETSRTPFIPAGVIAKRLPPLLCPRKLHRRADGHVPIGGSDDPRWSLDIFRQDSRSAISERCLGTPTTQRWVRRMNWPGSGWTEAGSAPTGLRQSAQGCEERATLGNREANSLNPEWVASSPAITPAANPLGL